MLNPSYTENTYEKYGAIIGLELLIATEQRLGSGGIRTDTCKGWLEVRL